MKHDKECHINASWWLGILSVSLGSGLSSVKTTSKQHVQITEQKMHFWKQ